MSNKIITFSDLMQEADHEPIWVLNKSAGDRRGNVFFTVPKLHGDGIDAVEVYNTFIPVCLTERVTRKQLLESSEFRKAVNRGFLKLISNDEAQSKLGETGADKEAERVRKLEADSSSSEAQFGLNAERNTAGTDATAGVSNPVIQFAALMENSNDMEALNSLRSMGDLQLAEYRFVMTAARVVKFDQVGRYCSQQIKAIKESIEE